MDEIKDNNTFTINHNNVTNNTAMGDTTIDFTDVNILHNQDIDKTNDNSAVTINHNNITNNTAIGDTTIDFTDANISNNQCNDKFVSSKSYNYVTSSQDINKNKPWRKYIRRRISDG